MSDSMNIIAGIILVGLICIVIVTMQPQATDSLKQESVPVPDKLAEIMARGSLIIATDSDYPPHSQLIPDSTRLPSTRCSLTEYTASQFSGYNIALAVEIANRFGVEPCFVTPIRTQITSGNWADRWDIHIGAMAITSERMKVLYFSQPYYAGPVVLFTHANTTASTIDDLSGKRIGVCAGCILERYLEGVLELPGQHIEYSIRNASIVAYENEVMALEDLGSGDRVILDAVLTNMPTGQEAIRRGLPIKVLGEPVFYDFDAAAVDRKTSRDPRSFMTKVSGIIREMHSDGTLYNLSMQYYGQDLSSEAGRYDIEKLHQYT